MKKEQKCKDEDDYKDYDKEKDAKRIIETLGVCYILGILMTQAFQVWCWNPLPPVILVFLVTHIVLVALVTHIVLVALVTLATLVTLVILVLWSSWST